MKNEESLRPHGNSSLAYAERCFFILNLNARGHAQRGPDSGENGDKGLNHDTPDVFLFHSF